MTLHMIKLCVGADSLDDLREWVAERALSAVAALIIGGTTLRLKGTFFVLSTIAFAEILKG